MSQPITPDPSSREVTDDLCKKIITEFEKKDEKLKETQEQLEEADQLLTEYQVKEANLKINKERAPFNSLGNVPQMSEKLNLVAFPNK